MPLTYPASPSVGLGVITTTTQALSAVTITFVAVAPTVSKGSTGVTPSGGPFLVLADWSNDGAFTGTGENVTGDVVGNSGIFWTRGKDQIRLLAPPAAGAFNAELYNRSREYSPANASSTLYPNVTPGRKTRVVKSGIYFSTTDRILGTYILDDIPQHPERERLSVELPSLGTLSRLRNKRVSTALYQNITTSAALGILLDEAGWPSGERTIDTGTTTLAWWWLDDDAFDAMVSLVATEGPGATCYEDVNGSLVFEARDYRTTASRCTSSQATFQDTADIIELQADMHFKDVIEAVTVQVDEREAQAIDEIWNYGAELTLGNDEVRSFQVRGGGDPFMNVQTPTAFGTNEVQTLTPSAVLTGGNFRLTFQGEDATIAYNADAATIQASLEGLTTIGSGNVLCGGGPINTTPVTVMFRGTMAATDQPLLETGDFTLNPVSTPTTINVVETNPDSPQTHTFFAASTPLTAGSWRIQYGVLGTTPTILWSATAAAVQSALENTSLFDPGDVSATGGPIDTDDVVVTYTDSLFGVPLPLPTILVNGLRSSQPTASVTVTETTKGTGPDYVISAGDIASITFDRLSGAYVTMTITAGPAGVTLADPGIRVRAQSVTVVRSHQVTRPVGTTVPEGRIFRPSNIRPEISLATAGTFADDILDYYDQPRPTVTFTTVKSIFRSTVDAVLAREISDRITIVDAQTGISDDFFIEQIRHSIQGLTLISEFGCEQADV